MSPARSQTRNKRSSSRVRLEKILKRLNLSVISDYKPEVSVSSRSPNLTSCQYPRCIQDVCLVNVDYDIRGTIKSYVRSCQPLNRCAYVTRRTCTRDGCCSEAPDRCLCRPGNHVLMSDFSILYYLNIVPFVFQARAVQLDHAYVTTSMTVK